MLRKKLVPIALSVLLTAGCAEMKSLYQDAKETYQKVKSKGDEYGISVNKERVELFVPEEFIPIPNKFNPELKGRVELNNVGYDLIKVRIGRVSARLNLSF